MKPYILYPMLLLFFIIAIIQTLFMFDGFERVRVRLRQNQRVQRSSRRKDN